MGFKKKTIENVIVPLVMKLHKSTGVVYNTLGEFYREVEILKFPETTRSKSRVCVYAQKQYESILDWLISRHLVSVTKNDGRYKITVSGSTMDFLKTITKHDFNIELEDFLNSEDILPSTRTEMMFRLIQESNEKSRVALPPSIYGVDIKPLETETPKEKIYTESEVIALFKKFTNDILCRGNEQWLQNNLK